LADFITLQGYADRYGITSSDKDPVRAEHIAAASSRVRAITHRDFSPHIGAATARTFRPFSCHNVAIDDAYEITAVGVDDNDDGTWSTAWTATHYDTQPANGVGPNGETGWPTTSLQAIGTLTFPTWSVHRRAVKVTAKWGWAAVPDAVIEATYLLARRYAYEVGVPGGVTPPNLEFGLPGQPMRRPYTAEDLLAPYVRADRAIGVAG
jgi:hypothetical protein